MDKETSSNKLGCEISVDSQLQPTTSPLQDYFSGLLGPDRSSPFMIVQDHARSPKLARSLKLGPRHSKDKARRRDHREIGELLSLPEKTPEIDSTPLLGNEGLRWESEPMDSSSCNDDTSGSSVRLTCDMPRRPQRRNSREALAA